MQKLVAALDAFSDWLGRSIAWLTLLMMLVTCIVVVVRYGFNMGSIALQESVVYLHGTIFLLGIGYTLRHQGHVRVDILYERFSPATRAIVDLLGTLLFLFPLAIFIFFSSVDYVAMSWSMQESSAQPGGLPGVFVLKTLIPVFAFFLFLQGIAELLRSVMTLTGRH